MSVTLKEIAEKANVSISTVSRVVNNDPNKPASKETTALIWRLVEELGYVPNQYARSLISAGRESTQNQQFKNVGFILTDKRNINTDPFFSEILAAAESEAVRCGTAITYTRSHASEQFYQDNYDGVDGVLFMGRTSLECVKHIMAHTHNIVYAGMNHFDLGFDEVLCDAYDATLESIQYFIGHGHRKIGFLGHIDPPEKQIYNEHRYEAFKTALLLSEIPLNRQYIRDTSSTAISGYSSMKDMLKSGEIPTAIFCISDIITLGAIKAIREYGLSIPGDISLISIGNTDIVSYLVPGVTSIEVPKAELGKAAFRLLHDRVTGGHTLPYRIKLPYTLVERDSCKTITV